MSRVFLVFLGSTLLITAGIMVLWKPSASFQQEQTSARASGLVPSQPRRPLLSEGMESEKASASLRRLLKGTIPLNYPFPHLERLAGSLSDEDLQQIIHEVGFQGATGIRGWIRCALFAEWGRRDPNAVAGAGLESMLDTLAREALIRSQGEIPNLEKTRPLLGEWYRTEIHQACFSLFRGRIERRPLDEEVVTELLEEFRRFGSTIAISSWIGSSTRFLFSEYAQIDPQGAWDALPEKKAGYIAPFGGLLVSREIALEGIFQGLRNPQKIQAFVKEWEPNWLSPKARKAYEAHQSHLRSRRSFLMPAPPEEAVGLEAALALARYDLQAAANWIEATSPAGKSNSYVLYETWASRMPNQALRFLGDHKHQGEQRHALAKGAILADPTLAHEIIQTFSEKQERERVLSEIIIHGPILRQENLFPTPSTATSLPDHYKRYEAILQAIESSDLDEQFVREHRETLNDRLRKFLAKEPGNSQ